MCLFLSFAPTVPGLCLDFAPTDSAPTVPRLCPDCAFCLDCARTMPQLILRFCPDCAPAVPRLCLGCASTDYQLAELTGRLS